MRVLLAALVLLAGMAAARAAECGSDATQMALNECAAVKFKRADDELNATYKQIVARLRNDQPALKRLTDAQRAWLRFRDAECDFVTGAVEGGSIRPMLIVSCRETETRARTEALTALLHCQEGDLSCPVPAR